jgi:hypothetical protein
MVMTQDSGAWSMRRSVPIYESVVLTTATPITSELIAAASTTSPAAPAKYGCLPHARGIDALERRWLRDGGWWWFGRLRLWLGLGFGWWVAVVVGGGGVS